MLRINKSIIVVASIVALSSANLVASGFTSDHEESYDECKLVDESDLRANTTSLQINDDAVTDAPAVELIQYSNHMLPLLDQGLFTRIMVDVSTHMNPAIFRIVCKRFKHLLDWESNPQAPSKFHQQGRLMQKCLKLWWPTKDLKRFNTGILRCTLPQGGAVVDLKFAELESTNGVFALPEVLADKFRVMKNVSEFFRISAEDAGIWGRKTLLLIVLHSEAENAARYMHEDHPFVTVVREWDISKAAVGYFYRSGYEDAMQCGFSYVTTQSFAEVSKMKSLYMLWAKKQANINGGLLVMAAPKADRMQCLFPQSENGK